MLDTGDLNNRKFTNTGHLANIFRSSTGRWKIINIYKYDSNKVYHAVSNRFPLSKVSIPVFREMGLYLR
jgi:muconolactone delta-isomerase